MHISTYTLLETYELSWAAHKFLMLYIPIPVVGYYVKGVQVPGAHMHALRVHWFTMLINCTMGLWLIDFGRQFNLLIAK